VDLLLGVVLLKGFVWLVEHISYMLEHLLDLHFKGSDQDYVLDVVENNFC
jgi:hypothetical protein